MFSQNFIFSFGINPIKVYFWASCVPYAASANVWAIVRIWAPWSGVGLADRVRNEGIATDVTFSISHGSFTSFSLSLKGWRGRNRISPIIKKQQDAPSHSNLYEYLYPDIQDDIQEHQCWMFCWCGLPSITWTTECIPIDVPTHAHHNKILSYRSTPHARPIAYG